MSWFWLDSSGAALWVLGQSTASESGLEAPDGRMMTRRTTREVAVWTDAPTAIEGMAQAADYPAFS